MNPSFRPYCELEGSVLIWLLFICLAISTDACATKVTLWRTENQASDNLSAKGGFGTNKLACDIPPANQPPNVNHSFAVHRIILRGYCDAHIYFFRSAIRT